ncbi:MAG: type II secretion system GspH family protein [Bdellovibrionaceae bacterium]|nr:type II secretion system GspH family protein [Pseudobdellovibrionaceae bacterium]
MEMLRRQDGFTLTELVIALGIFAILATIVFAPQLNVYKTLVDSERKAARVGRVHELKQSLIAAENSLNDSSTVTPENERLCPCLRGGSFMVGGVPICNRNTCDANRDEEFAVHQMVNGALERVTGTVAAPVYYLADGRRCMASAATSETECDYKLLTKFNAHCPGDVASCDHADYVILTMDTVPVGNRSRIAAEKTQIFYTVQVNYAPSIEVIANQVMVVNETRKIAVKGGSGHPSELQRLVFEKCESSDTARLIAKCYRFVDGTGQLILEAKATGTVTVTLQVNDGQTENPISAPLTFNVTINP